MIQIRLHTDLTGLIWIADGPNKNFDPLQKIRSFESAVIFSNSDIEPSSIFTSLPISDQTPINEVEKLPYYPSYHGMTPEQRWKYIKFLENPYDATFEIGYVFVLYYGLERHLLFGDFDRAFDVILKLKTVHSNSSFQTYSSNALFISSAKHKRIDKIMALLYSKHINISYPQFFIFAKALTNEGLTANEIVNTSKAFGFKNQRYISSDPELFENQLEEAISTVYPDGKIPVSNFLSSDLPKTLTFAFANISIEDRVYKLPNLLDSQIFRESVYKFLQLAHDRVKIMKRKKH
jgi:hypothetical protein